MLSKYALYVAPRQQLMVIGDVHGHYLPTLQLINQIEPDYLENGLTDIDEVVAELDDNVGTGAYYELDTIFVFVGDIIDRGPHSFEMLKLVSGITHLDSYGYGSTPPFVTVWGNHEELMYRALGGELEYLHSWSNNGGKWFFELSDKNKRIAEKAIEYLYARSGVSLTVNYLKTLEETCDPFLDKSNAEIVRKVGVVHAECPVDDWKVFNNHRGYRQDALWSRESINQRRTFDTISNVDLVIAGHTPRDNIVSIGNQRWVNTKKTIGGLLIGLDKETNLLTEHTVGVF